MFTHYDRAHIAQLCENAGLLQRVSIQYILAVKDTKNLKKNWLPSTVIHVSVILYAISTVLLHPGQMSHFRSYCILSM